MAELAPPATMKTPVRAGRSRSGRTAARPGSASQELFSKENATLVFINTRNPGCPCVVRLDIFVENGHKVSYYFGAMQGSIHSPVDIHRCARLFTSARQRDSKVSVF